MTRERQVKGPLSSIEHDGKEYRVEYRHRYYETSTHFTWIEIQLSQFVWIDSDSIQTGLKRLTKKVVRQLAKEAIEQHHKRNG